MDIQVWGRRLFLLIAKTVGFVFLSYLVLLLVFALDLHPYFSAGTQYWFYGFFGIFLGWVLALEIVGIILARKLWLELLPNVPRWSTLPFWLVLPLPELLPLLYLVPAWKRGRAARILSLLTALVLLSLCILIPLAAKFLPELEGIPFGAVPDKKLVWTLIAQLLLPVCFAALLIPLCQMRFTRSMRIVTASTLTLIVLSFVLPYPLMKMIDTRWDQRIMTLRKAGGVTDMKTLAELYFQGKAPNPEWCDLVDSHQLQNDINIKPAPAENPEQNRKVAGTTAKMLADYRSNPDMDELERRYSVDTPEIKLLERLFASDASRLVYSRDFTHSITSMQMPDLQCFSSAAQCFSKRGQTAAERGDSAESLRDFHFCLRVADNLFDGGEILIGGLVGMSAERSAFEILRSAIKNRCLSSQELDTAEKTLAAREKNYRDIMRNVMRCEIVFCVDTAERLIKTGGDIEHPEKYSLPPMRNPLGAPVYCFLKNNSSFCLDEWSRILESMNMPDWIPPEQTNSAQYPGRRGIPTMLLPSMDLIWKYQTRMNAQNRIAQIACRVELFRMKNGRLPNSLSECGNRMPSDPFNLQPFQYRPAPDGSGFQLWSVGDDRKDDNGTTRADLVFDCVVRAKAKKPSEKTNTKITE